LRGREHPSGAFRCLAANWRLSGRLSPTSNGAFSFPQQEILEHEISFPTGKQAAAGAARQRAVNSFWSGFAFDQLIERVAVRTRERIERCRPVRSHDTPPTRAILDC
jgi:hypothetical protein